MNILSLDIGKRRTGVAFSASQTQVPVALDTIAHKNSEDLVDAILSITKEKQVNEVVCGLPLLPSGEEGEQCMYTRSIADLLAKSGLNTHFLDERYTTPQTGEIDPDSSAACTLLLAFLDRQKRSG